MYKVDGVVANKPVNRVFKTDYEARCFIKRVLVNFLVYFDKGIRLTFASVYPSSEPIIVTMDLLCLADVQLLIDELKEIGFIGSKCRVWFLYNRDGNVIRVG